VLEFGCNCGAASLLLAARRPDICIVGVEIDPSASMIFSKNIALNHLEEKVFSICTDLRDFNHWDLDMKNSSCKKYNEDIKSKPTAGKECRYDMVFFNPPYRVPGREKDMNTDSPELRNARFEINGGIEDFIRAAKKALLPNGKLVIVHRASRLSECFSFLEKYKLQPELLRMVHSRKDKEAKLFLLGAKMNGRPGGFKVLPPLILYEKSHEQKLLKKSEELKKIYGDE